MHFHIKVSLKLNLSEKQTFIGIHLHYNLTRFFICWVLSEQQTQKFFLRIFWLPRGRKFSIKMKSSKNLKKFYLEMYTSCQISLFSVSTSSLWSMYGYYGKEFTVPTLLTTFYDSKSFYCTLRAIIVMFFDNFRKNRMVYLGLFLCCSFMHSTCMRGSFAGLWKWILF